ncbi:MAG: hypothetical protein AAGK00_00615 [Pseudomonadota bacterium]
MPFDEFENIARMSATQMREQVHHDLQGEKSGAVEGRMARVMVGENVPSSHDKKKRERAQQLMTELEQLMRDPAYEAAYNDFDDFLRTRAIATDTAIELALKAQTVAHNHLTGLNDKANRLPDGSKAFKTADGRVVDEHGRDVGHDDAAGVVWRDGAPTWEEYKAAKDAAAEADARLFALYDYQTDLAETRERLENEDEPVMRGQMEEERERLERDGPDLSQSANTVPVKTPNSGNNLTNIASPNLSV